MLFSKKTIAKVVLVLVMGLVWYTLVFHTSLADPEVEAPAEEVEEVKKPAEFFPVFLGKIPSHFEVWKFHDEVTGVTCYFYKNSIWCLPPGQHRSTFFE